MKLFVGDGRTLDVYDLGPLVMRLRADKIPLKEHGWRLVEDDMARGRLRELLDSGLYAREVG